MKRVYVFCLTLILFLTVVSAIDRATANQIKECREDCRELNKISKFVCNEEFSECKNICENGNCKRVCTQERRDCLREVSGEYKTCQKECINNNEQAISSEGCTQSGGLYQQLCTGPYFSVFCTQKSYCLCEGINNNACPAQTQCSKNFVAPVRRHGSLEGWRNLHGESLGDIGMCK